MKQLNRVSTGIKNLDTTIEGGYKEKSINLIEGGPGTGKSIFAMQYLVSGIRDHSEKGIYITFEEERETLMDNMVNFKWDLQKLEADNKLEILDISPLDVVNLVKKKSLGLKFEIVKKIQAKRIVIDSITAYSLLFEEGLIKKQALNELFKTLRTLDCTALLIAERKVDIDSIASEDLVDFQVDSIISVYNTRKSDIRERSMEVRKIRGTKNMPKIFPMRISEKGVEIYPDGAVF
ncbi:MAG: ATPase domain-containing protein [archaeon]